MSIAPIVSGEGIRRGKTFRKRAGGAHPGSQQSDVAPPPWRMRDGGAGAGNSVKRDATS